MTGKFLHAVWMAFLVGLTLAGTVRANYPPENGLIARPFSGPGSSGFGQIQITTPTPQVSGTDQQEAPISSEVGKDVGLVVGAAALVLIVIAGLLLGYLPTRKSKSPPKTRD